MIEIFEQLQVRIIYEKYLCVTILCHIEGEVLGLLHSHNLLLQSYLNSIWPHLTWNGLYRKAAKYFQINIF